MILGIIGLGLIGGSFALASREIEYIDKIVGIDHNEQHKEKALELNIIDEIIEFNEIIECDIIVIATPIKAIINIMSKLSKLKLKENVTIIDFGSTKQKIIKECPLKIRSKFIASHPMAGTEYSGPTAAIKDLFKNKIIVMCNIEENKQYQLNIALNLFKQLEMNIKIMDAKEHDRHAAFISHMPHIVSYSLANAVLKQEDNEHIIALAAGGFKSMARLAKSNPSMWKEIFETNEDNILESIEYFIEELNKAKKLIKKRKYKKLEKWMMKGNKLHNIL